MYQRTQAAAIAHRNGFGSSYQRDTDNALESATGSGASTVRTHSVGPETIFSDTESVVTESTDPVPPSSNGLSDEEKERTTVLSPDDEPTLTPEQKEGIAKNVSFSNPGGGSATADAASLGAMKVFLAGDGDTDSPNVPPNKVVEEVDRLMADLKRASVEPTASSSVGHGLIPARPVVGASGAMAEDRDLLQHTMPPETGDLKLLILASLGTVLDLEKLRDICKYCEMSACCTSAVEFFTPQASAQPPEDNTRVSSKSVADLILEIMAKGFGESAPLINCWVCIPPHTAALRFGLDGKIILHLIDNGEPITFVCCDETFPSPGWAEKAAKAFLEGAKPWAAAGLTFKQVGRNEPAHFRIAFSLFPGNLDCTLVAQAFFPGTKSATERTLWVYLLAFHEYNSNYMSGHMGHEAGHIVGIRHGFDEHFQSDGSEIPMLRSASMGPENVNSVMKYHTRPAKYWVQESDVKDLKDMLTYPKAEYKGYKIVKAKPDVHVFPTMMSFSRVEEFLASQGIRDPVSEGFEYLERERG
ncbi:hypothetical protein F4824DRAFT_462104 [Ustulina deusta]|nr:hypothetical protein F4824DRAFT_462104 [Ustulina deusta]